MDRKKSLEDLKPIWMDRVSHSFTSEESVQAEFIDQLNEFYDRLSQAHHMGDPSILDRVLNRWISNRTQREFDNQEMSLSEILNHMLLTTYDIIFEFMDSKLGIKLIGDLLPIFIYAINFGNKKETQLHIDKIADELDKVRETHEKIDKSKSDFISVAAHELKTPLTLIEGYASMVIDQLLRLDPQTQYTIYLQGLENGINRLQEIINDMIDVSLIDNHLLTLKFQPVWINKLLEIIENELSIYFQDRSQSFLIHPFDGSDQMIFGDPERLHQAFRNLLTNAIKYTPDGGEITIDGRRLPGFIEMTITDTGIGIHQDDHDQIFKKFGRLGSVQFHSSGKLKFKGGGPGLGLPITKGLIEAHGGTIWVESPGYDEINCPGTTFHILLPILKEPPDMKIAKLFRPLSEVENSSPLQ